MSTNYNLILQELNEPLIDERELPSLPYNDNTVEKVKIETLYRYLIRAVRLKQRISSLIYGYYLGQLVMTGTVNRKAVRKIVSDHYYFASIRLYYIFENIPQQIYATKILTLAMVKKLKQEEFSQLVLEL